MNQPDQLPALQIAMPVLQKHRAFGRPLTFDRGPYEVTTSTVVLDDLIKAGYKAGQEAERARADALQADLARLSEAIRNTFSVPHSVLRRGENGRCSRSTCLCEAEGLGAECVWLVPTDKELQRRTGEPHIDGYPLHSGLPTRADALEAALRELVRAQERYWAPAPTGGDEQRNRAMYAARALLEKPHG